MTDRPATDAAQVLRPGNLGANTSVSGVVVPAVLVLVLLVVGTGRRWVWLAPALLIGGLLGGYIWLLRRNAYVRAGPGSLTVRNAVGRVGHWDGTQLGTLVLTAQERTGSSGRFMITRSRLHVLDPNGKQLTVLDDGAYRRSDLETIARLTGAKLDLVPDPVSLGKLRRRHRGSVSWASAHPAVVGLLISLLLVIALVTWAVIDIAHGNY